MDSRAKLKLILSVIVVADAVADALYNESSVNITQKACNFDKDCRISGQVNSPFCDLRSKICTCRQSSSTQNFFTILVNDTLFCLSGKTLGTECQVQEECRLFDPSSTCNNQQECECEPDFSVKNDSCVRNQDDGLSHKSEVNTQMLPIMIVMGLMFIGMCGAMHMFSKARFDDRQRGVFAASGQRIVKTGSQRRTQRRASRQPAQLGVAPRVSPDHSLNFEPSLEPLTRPQPNEIEVQ